LFGHSRETLPCFELARLFGGLRSVLA
jgi:hypothetical protein